VLLANVGKSPHSPGEQSLLLREVLCSLAGIPLHGQAAPCRAFQNSLLPNSQHCLRAIPNCLLSHPFACHLPPEFFSGEDVNVKDEVVVINSISLPHKSLSSSVMEEIIL